MFLPCKRESEGQSDSDSSRISIEHWSLNVMFPETPRCAAYKRRTSLAPPKSLCSTKTIIVYINHMQWSQHLSVSSVQCLGEMQSHMVWKGRTLERSLSLMPSRVSIEFRPGFPGLYSVRCWKPSRMEPVQPFWVICFKVWLSSWFFLTSCLDSPYFRLWLLSCSTVISVKSLAPSSQLHLRKY